jgi:glycosyltransferase involved in cell wall biosynthesis
MSVSYVIPVYNKAAFLPRVLAHVEAEWRETGGEIVVVDDGSTDASPAEIGRFADGRPHVRVIVQANGGVAAATNRGFAAASCPLLRLVDGDDLVVPGSTRRLLRALEDHDAGLAFGRFVSYSGAPDQLTPPDIAAAPSWRVADPVKGVFAKQSFIPSVTLAVREQVADCFPLPEGYRTSQDFIMSVRFARRTGFAEVDGLCCWMPAEAPGRLSGSKARMYADSARLLADEWEAASDGPWTAAIRRYAVQRQAMRAYLYAKRHLKPDAAQRVWLLSQRLFGHLPWYAPGPAALRRIADTYAEALAAPERFP